MNNSFIELYSDTKTRPSAGMLAAMTAAETGDEQAGEDPTTNRLCGMVAELLGKEAAVFLPSGTMCNQIALAVHCRSGDEIIADETAHIINFEVGGAASIAGAMIRPAPGAHGIFSAEQVANAIRPDVRHMPKSRLVSVEQTSNLGGGTVWPLETLGQVSTVAKDAGLLVHMDGARLMNAVVASGVAAADYAALTDTLWIDLSKGLGCPIGGVLAGSKAFIEEAWFWKQRLGGSMRQSGVIAAAGIYALDHNVDRLAEDHENARVLAEVLHGVDGVSVPLETVQTNIVIVDVSNIGKSAPEISAELLAKGVRMGALDKQRLRAVTHLDVSREGVERAGEIFAEVCAG
jgi:threonine aldolase